MKNLQICFEYKAKITNKIPKLRDWLETFVLLSEDFFSSGGLTPILSFLWNVSFHHDPIKVFLVAWSASNNRAKMPLYATVCRWFWYAIHEYDLYLDKVLFENQGIFRRAP